MDGETDSLFMAEALSPMLAGTLRPAGRSWHARLLHWAADARAHRVICLVMAVWLLNGFDLTFTILANEQGLLQEQNPLARKFLADGPASMILFKVGLVLIGSYPLLRYRRARITEMATLVILIAYGLLAVHWSECYKLYTLTSGGPVNIAEITPSTSLFSP
jgi:hypothetical protein